jgi:four helix bundle protein
MTMARGREPGAGNGYVKSFKDLEAYRRAFLLAREVFEISRAFPKEETYSLTDQMRRASRSVGAQIAEAWAKRRYRGHFISKLTDADGELQETIHWIDMATSCRYLSDQQKGSLTEHCAAIGRMLNGMLEKADLFVTGPRPPAPGPRV